MQMRIGFLLLSFGEQQVVNEEWLVRYPTIATEGGLEGSVLGLRFRLREEHFDRRGRMQVTCTASVGRMRIDGRTRLNISSADTSGTGGSDSYSSSAPKQRSLILDSRSSAVSQSSEYTDNLPNITTWSIYELFPLQDGGSAGSFLTQQF